MKREIKFKAWIPALKMFLEDFTIHQLSEMIGIDDESLREQLEAKGYHIDDEGDVRVTGNDENAPITSFLCGEDYYWYDKEFELCQFTGLKDKNGVDIYEGDILEEDPFHKSRFEVVWDSYYCKLKLDWTRVCGHIQYPEWNRGIKMAVIGNIYGNPELLTKQ